MPASEVRREQAALLKLGVVFMASAVMMMGAAYAIRILVTREIGIEAAGLYQSAWAVGGLYVGLILQAMGADFYPRLTAVAHDNAECNRVVNEQAHVSLLLAGPGVLATIILAPLIISVLYTAEFKGAVSLLRWLCLGISLRVISWPLGFILVAKGDRRKFLLSESAWTLVYVSLAVVCVHSFGLDGAGMAFFGAYALHIMLNYWLVRRASRFRWSVENVRAAIWYLATIGLVFVAFQRLTGWLPLAVGMLALAWSLVRSSHTLLRLVSLDRVPRSLVRLLKVFRLAPDA
jgi:PST family polysaccharide transporter